MNEYEPKINLRKSLLIIALVLMVAGLIGWLLKPEIFAQLFEAIRNANHPLIGVAIASYMCSIVVWSIRWRTALRSAGDENPGPGFATLFSIIWSAIFLNNVTPFVRTGGDPFGRIYMVRKLASVKYSTAIAATLGEHVFDPPFVVAFLLVGLFLQFGRGSLPLTMLLLVAGTLLVLVMVISPRFILKKMIGVKLIGRIVTRIAGRVARQANAQRIAESIEHFYSNTFAVMGRRREGLSIGGLTALMWALDLLRLHIILQALGTQSSIALLMLASSLPTIMGLLSFLPGGLVAVEGSLISVLVLFGVPLEVATAVTLIERGITFVLSSIIGAGAFFYLGVKMSGRKGPALEAE
jgi:glycosyltransferase 2 family protein